MRLLLCSVLFMVIVPVRPMPPVIAPGQLDTPDDDQEVAAAGGTGVNPQEGQSTGSSYFLPSADSSSSSSSEEDGSDGDSSLGIAPAGTLAPGVSPVVAGDPAGANAGGVARGSGRAKGAAGSTDQNSGEQVAPGGRLILPESKHQKAAILSKIDAEPRSDGHKPNAGKSVGIAVGVLGLVSVATVAMIFAIRKRRGGFSRLYTPDNSA